MKNTKIILLAAVAMATIFSAVIFTSCTKKVTCDTVTCRNGGTCDGGSCTCPTGYTGNFCEVAATTYIVYKNNTFTPITFTSAATGLTQVIPVGQQITISGLYGTTSTGTATTSGTAASLGVNNPAGVIGLIISWDINNNFPSVATDTLRQTLDVGATYYFLRMANKTGQNIINYYVQNTTDTLTNLRQYQTIPNTGTTYDLGYYLAYPTSSVLSTLSTGSTALTSVTLPFTSNQTFTATVN